jgi:hypothetical protein
MTDNAEKPRILGKEATYVALEAEKYGPVRIRAADDSAPGSNEPVDMAEVPVPSNLNDCASPESNERRSRSVLDRKPIVSVYRSPERCLAMIRASCRRERLLHVRGG